MRTIRVLTKTIILFIALAFQNSYGQSTIIGSVSDSKGQPIINGNVLLLKSTDSSLIKGVVTDKGGNFIFEKIRIGKYLLSSSHIGFNQIYTPVFTINNNDKINLGNLKHTEAEKNLDGVTVVTKRPLYEQKIDRMVINVANSITSAGNTVLDILERSPGVIVDKQNNSISINGKDGVVIMINGRRNNIPVAAIIQSLGGMNSSNIERIELLTTPPANYDAEGNAGYINIVLKVNAQLGTNGSYSLFAGIGRGYTGGSSINFNHRNGKINLYGDLSFSIMKVYQLFDFDRTTNYQLKLVETHNHTDRDFKPKNINGRLALIMR